MANDPSFAPPRFEKVRFNAGLMCGKYDHEAPSQMSVTHGSYSGEGSSTSAALGGKTVGRRVGQ
jgi:hypothetical protein